MRELISTLKKKKKKRCRRGMNGTFSKKNPQARKKPPHPHVSLSVSNYRRLQRGLSAYGPSQACRNYLKVEKSETVVYTRTSASLFQVTVVMVVVAFSLRARIRGECSTMYSPPAPQWGAADAEIKVPSGENTELKRSPFKAWSRSVYSHTCYAY